MLFSVTRLAAPAALASAVLLVLAGCSSAPATPAAEGGTVAMVCDRETPTGTFISVTKCRTPEQIEQTREESRRRAEEMNRPRQSPNANTPGR